MVPVKAAAAAKATVRAVQTQAAQVVSPALKKFLGVGEMSRVDVTKRIWSYVRENNLQDPANKRNIICDDKLKVLFNKDRVDFLEVQKLLSTHLTKKPSS